MVVGKPESTREKKKLYSVFCVVLLIDQLFIWHNKKNCKDATTRAPYPFFDGTFRKVYFKFSFASLDRCIAENADGILLCCAWLIILSWLYVYICRCLGIRITSKVYFTSLVNCSVLFIISSFCLSGSNFKKISNNFFFFHLILASTCNWMSMNRLETDAFIDMPVGSWQCSFDLMHYIYNYVTHSNYSRWSMPKS